MNAEVITVGNEILTGQVVDTNAAFLGRRLEEMGVSPEWITSARDHGEAIRQALRNALERAALVIVTGGLGPTHDDVTKEACAAFFHRALRLDDALFEQIKDRFARRGLQMPEVNRNQALVPEGATVLPNDQGTAPGLYIESNGSHIFLLPGVPREMRGLFEERVVPILTRVCPSQVIKHRILRTTGISESGLFERLGSIAEHDSLAFLPQGTGVDVRITLQGTDDEALEEKLHAIEGEIRARAGEFIYGVDGELLERVVGQHLRKQGWKIAVAESCTGGLIASRLTDIPGSSDYFERGIVAYSNRSKSELLDVPEGTLAEHGAVSEQTASAMAAGVRARSDADIGLAVTGIAGPSGGTPEKPVGRVFVGLSTEEETCTQPLQLTGNRLIIKQRTAQAALEMVRRYLAGERE